MYRILIKLKKSKYHKINYRMNHKNILIFLFLDYGFTVYILLTYQLNYNLFSRALENNHLNYGKKLLENKLKLY